MRVVAPLGVITALVLTAALGPVLQARSPLALQDTLSEALRSGNRAEFRAALTTGVTFHPAEPAFALLAASEAVQHHDARAPRWLNRAMTLAPAWASPHTQAARWLLSTGRLDQALLEIREAARRDPADARAPMCTVIASRPDARLVFRATPNGENGIDFLARVVATCVDPMSPLSVAIDERLRRDAPGLVEPRMREARRRIARGEVAQAIDELRVAVRRRPDDGVAQTTLAEALLASNRPREAIAALRAAETRVDDLRPLVQMRARAEAATHDEAAMRSSIDELRGLAGSNSEELAAALTLQGTLEAGLGNDHMSLRAFEEAYTVLPGPTTLEGVATAAERAGESGTAYQSYSKLVDLVPTEPRYRAALARLTHAPPSRPSP